MKKIAMALLAVAALLAAGVPSLAAAQSRPGVIEDLQPIENRGDDESAQTRQGRTWGQRLGGLAGIGLATGVAASGNSSNLAGQAATVVAGSGDQIGGEIGARAAGPGPTTRYMVKVRLDSGRVLTITQLREQIEGLQVGSRVRVDGRGDDAKVSAEQ